MKLDRKGTRMVDKANTVARQCELSAKQLKRVMQDMKEFVEGLPESCVKPED